MRALTLLLAAAVSGCTCTPPPTPDGGADGGELRGDFIERFLLRDGTVMVAPQRLTARTITAFVEKADGTFDAFAGAGLDDGTFVVPGVPQGPYTIQVGAVLVHSDTRVIHLGSNSLGRPDVFQAAPGEGLELSVANLAPWTGDDELQFTSWNAGIGYYSTATRSPGFDRNGPDAGDAALDRAFVDFKGEAVVQQDKGDDLYITQLSGRTLDGGTRVRVATRALPVDTTLRVGIPTPVGGTFTTLPLTGSTFDFRAAQFVAPAAQVHPGAEAYVARLLVSAHPGPFGRTTHTGGTPDLAIVELLPDAGDTQVAVSYGNPYPAPWTPFVSCGALFDVLYRAPLPDGGLASPRSEVGFVSMAVTGAAAAAGPLEPLVTPPRALTLDGLDATATQPDVALTPVVAWTAPEKGAVTRTEIDVVQLNVNALGLTTRRIAGTLRVIGPQTSVRLPPGLLNPNNTYFLRVTALTLPPEYQRDWPLLDVGPPAGASSALTAAFQTRAPP